MELQLFDSLTNKVNHLSVSPEKSVNIYLCGPTVYNHIHCGNLRPVIIFDILHRLLLALNIKVDYTQNITDIDDKIIRQAKKEKVSEKKIAVHYTKSYLANLVNYNVLFPHNFPRVSNYIFSIQKFIKQLVKKNYAYQSRGEVLFHTGINKSYGKLSGQNLEKLQVNSREIVTADKNDRKDFVLWKKTNEGIAWNSPWGFGRPGWHTECAVFVQELFASKTIDIHGGGNDLLFPHHENERIQYLANNNKELSHIWLHIAHINWQNEKMSKSLGNVILAKHFYQRYGANVFRYLIVNSHYNQVINFSEELIQQAINYTQKIENLLKKINFYLYTKKVHYLKKKNQLSIAHNEVIQNLLNNLNTVKVLYILEKTINFLNKSIDEVKSPVELTEKISVLYFILNILGFKFDLPTYTYSVKLLIKNWQNFRANKQYILADQVRNQLQKIGIL